jgi:hypothetical protein
MLFTNPALSKRSRVKQRFFLPLMRFTSASGAEPFQKSVPSRTKHAEGRVFTDKTGMKFNAVHGNSTGHVQPRQAPNEEIIARMISRHRGGVKTRSTIHLPQPESVIQMFARTYPIPE